jgi:hypothetical protein
MSMISDLAVRQVIARLARERGIPEWQMEMILAEPAGFMREVIGDRSKPIHEPSSPMVPKPKGRPSATDEVTHADAERRAEEARKREPGGPWYGGRAVMSAKGYAARIYAVLDPEILEAWRQEALQADPLNAEVWADPEWHEIVWQEMSAQKRWDERQRCLRPDLRRQAIKGVTERLIEIGVVQGR